MVAFCNTCYANSLPDSSPEQTNPGFVPGFLLDLPAGKASDNP
jgi:hypothetical protein